MSDFISIDKASGKGPTSLGVTTQPNETQFARAGGVRVTCKDKTITVSVNQEKSPDIITIPEFDYLVLRYSWTDISGKDYDSATEFLNTGIFGVDNVLVGWSKQMQLTKERVENFLIWGGDNTQSGAEAALIQMKPLLSDPRLNPLTEDIRLRVYGNWYNSAAMGNGYVTISFTAYKGGYMIKNGTNFVNDGGELVYEGSKTTRIPENGENNYQNIRTAYKTVADVYYNRETRDCYVQIKS